VNVVDLHPEELFDKEEGGSLTQAERARLDAHVARCEACRLERRLRADFAAELGDEAEESQLPSQVLVAIVAGAKRSVAAPAPLTVEPPLADAERTVATVTRLPLRRRARWTVLIAAAAVAVVGVAAASETAGGHWIRRIVGVEATESVDEGGAATVAPRGAAKTAAREAPTAPPEAPSAVVVEPAEQERPSGDVARSPSDPLATEVHAAPQPRPPGPGPGHVAATVSSVSLAAPASAPSPVRAPDHARWAPSAEPEGASALLEEATSARRGGDYARAITLSRRLQASFPDSREAHVSQAALGRLLLDTGDPAGALASFDGYLARRGGQLDEAVMVGRAIALDRLGRTDEARRGWSALIAAFPSSPYADHARSRAGAPGP
jgi:TolA-binding protein